MITAKIATKFADDRELKESAIASAFMWIRLPFFCFFMILMATAGACTSNRPAPSAEPQLATTATIREIMHSIVDPSAEFLFDSLYQIVDEKGVRDIEPRTSEEWEMVRRHALLLFEAPNLFTMEDRKVTSAGEDAEHPEVQLRPVDIQKLIEDDRAAFKRRAKRLQDAAASAISAIDDRDKTALLKALTDIDHACENCHLHYWYPNDKRAWEAAKENGLVID